MSQGPNRGAAGTNEADGRAWVEAALGWCDATDAMAMRHFRRDLQLERKPDRSFVTVADRTIERLLRDRIAAAFPGHGVVGEELGVEEGSTGVQWYVDPIDGTHNFLRGIPLFATLLAAARDGELVAAVLSAPALRQRWYAWRGGGAWAAGAVGAEAPRRIEVSRVAHVSEAQILYASASSLEASGRAPGFRALIGDAWRERGFGDFWGYTLVAEGAAEAMVEVDLWPWDAAAPMLLVEEAGGRVTDFDGRRSFEGGTFLATNGQLHETIRRTLVESSSAAGGD
ncbi:MAG TPA: inositol monophosphatase family protein [Candidatus Limnocylindrales bacterium]|nr:inositol monophosphatase family protein [Candidatus Limnocylindrales bacterium]